MPSESISLTAAQGEGLWGLWELGACKPPWEEQGARAEAT